MLQRLDALTWAAHARPERGRQRRQALRMYPLLNENRGRIIVEEIEDVGFIPFAGSDRPNRWSARPTIIIGI